MNWISKISESVEFIEKNLFGPINAEAVGKAINYAPSSFSNLFSAVAGYSIGEYIRFRRLSAAAELLSKNETNVTDAAFMCGYETTEAFSKAFKRLFGRTPSRFADSELKFKRFSPIKINFSLDGGFNMVRNIIPGLQKVDWSDAARQNEFVNGVVSALGSLGEELSYDYVCAVSGCAFRTSFSKRETCEWNHGNYHVSHTPIIILHTFRMLGYGAARIFYGDFETDKQFITESVDRGIPVITLEGVINCSDACVISGYDDGGRVLLGYNPFMYVEDDHNEAHDDTGYFRKSNWYTPGEGSFIFIDKKTQAPDRETIFGETLKIIKRLILDETMFKGQHNGLAAHSAFAEALMNYEWEDNFEPYLNVMCNYKQYLDRKYAVKFFADNGRGDLAEIYSMIAARCEELGKIIPQDFSAGDLFNDKNNLKPYCETLLEIRNLEERAAGLM